MCFWTFWEFWGWKKGVLWGCKEELQKGSKLERIVKI